MEAEKADPGPAWAPALGRVVEELDAQIRIAGVRAHSRVIEEIAKVKDAKIGEFDVPRESLLPRDVLTSERITMEVTVFLRSNGVSFGKGIIGGGSPAKIAIEWAAKPAPESTALVRTKAETILAKEIQHG